MTLRCAVRAIGQAGLGLFLTSAGVSHLTVNRIAFRAQVPTWLPHADTGQVRPLHAPA
jgi:hypothetical protein